MIKQFSIEYLIEKKSCVFIRCDKCPFEQYGFDIKNPTECYDIGIKTYMKQQKIKAILK